MNDMLDPNKMAEATRLTRVGRLAEAVALLQRMLRAESPREMTFGTEVDIVPTGRAPPIIDPTAKSGETDCPPSSCLVVYPAQSSEANAAKCWNWFRPSDQQRDQGEPSLIAGITRQVMRAYSVDAQRVYIGGLSAGAAAAAVMGATYSDLYAAIGVHSGLACGAANDLPSAFTAMRPGDFPASSGPGEASTVLGYGLAVPTIVFHGDRDNTVHPRNGDHVIAQKRITNLQKNVHRGRVPGGHAYTRTIQ